MTVAATGEQGAESSDRESRLARAVEALRTRANASEAERWFKLAGPVLMPLGALVILLAWYGAANTTRVFLQIPYLISGGLLGLGLMFVGSFVYFARWLNDLLDASRGQAAEARVLAERSAAALERIEHLLAQQTGGAPVATGSFVVTANGKLVHTADCRLAVGRDVTVLSDEEAYAGKPCQVCNPF
jgi:hypothetical protein